MQDLKAIPMLNQIYRVYIFIQFIDQDDLNKMIMDYEHVNELFCTIEDLFSRLVSNIKFYLEKSFYLPIASFFTELQSMKGNFPLKLSDKQEQFTAFQLFIKTLRQMPSSIVCHQQFYERCLAYTRNQFDCRNVLETATSETDLLIDWFVNTPFLSAVINSLLHQQILNNLFDIQHLIVSIDRYIAERRVTTLSLVVYRVQLIRAQDLELIQQNTDELIAFHTFIVATKDFTTIRKIARHAVNDGHHIITFEIEIPWETHVAKIDEDRFMFQFGSIFHIQSINLAPDGVWYVRLNYTESKFECIQTMLQIQVDERLTWLTLGSYLSALNYSNEAMSYYEYLIKALPDDDEALPAIYNNMGSVNMALDKKEEAFKCFQLALNSLKATSPRIDHCIQPALNTTLSTFKQEKLIIPRSDVYEKMAQAQLGLLNSEEALKFYRKALELEIEPASRARLEQKIKTLGVMLK